MKSNAPQILIIDDEPQILRALRAILGDNGFQVITAETGELGLELAQTQLPDVIILDLTLPRMSGLEVCTQLRKKSQVPIIILSVRDSEKDKVAALDQGADDYLTKPFGIEELLARIRVALRHQVRQQGATEEIIVSQGLTIDLTRHLVTRDKVEIKLTATEYKLLAYLAINADRVLTHQVILHHVWGAEVATHVEYLRVYIRQLRRKIELDPEQPQILLNEPGIGYRFIATA